MQRRIPQSKAADLFATLHRAVDGAGAGSEGQRGCESPSSQQHWADNVPVRREIDSITAAERRRELMDERRFGI